MNSLSWCLYAIDVIGNLKYVVIGLAAIAGFGWAVLNVAVPVSEGDILEWADYKKWWVRSAIICIFAAITACALPSTNTMYAIAASQVGEQIVSNEAVKGVAGDATKALQQWIKRQIEPEKKG